MSSTGKLKGSAVGLIKAPSNLSNVLGLLKKLMKNSGNSKLPLATNFK